MNTALHRRQNTICNKLSSLSIVCYNLVIEIQKLSKNKCVKLAYFGKKIQVLVFFLNSETLKGYYD